MGSIDISMSAVSKSSLTLHDAARTGDVDLLQGLLGKSHAWTGHKSAVNGQINDIVDIDAVENDGKRRTPLMVACVEGHLDIVEALVEAGAHLQRVDAQGLNARELATLEGNLRIAIKLRETEIERGIDPDLDTTQMFTSPLPRVRESVAEGPLGERAMILVKLGSGDWRKSFRVVKLGPHYSEDSATFTGLLSIKMSAGGDNGPPQFQDVDVQDNCATQPVVFYAHDPTRVKLIFDLVHPVEEASQQQPPGARAVALLSNLLERSSTHMSLYGDITVPLISEIDRDVVGSLTFNILIARPYQHPTVAKAAKQRFPPSTRINPAAKTLVVGHRGLGKNMEAKDFLQLGENTIESFNTAARLGAEFVEFDVQVTKDRVPVIYHDFLVGEAGVDIPIHEVTTEQLINLGNRDIGSPSSLPSPPMKQLSARPRAMSSGFLEGAQNDITNQGRDRENRMAYTLAMRARGFKANTPGRHIVAPFTTLEEMFHKINKRVGFNIEVKYPMLNESEGHGNPAWNSWELNLFVDTILNKVFDLCHSANIGNADEAMRKIYFSSFNADVCLLLKLKQDRLPVMFLTNADNNVRPADRVVSDPRASSLSQAIAFCEDWGLDGIVSEAVPFVTSPRLVRFIRERGLRCASYGTVNNDVDNVKRQVGMGIDAVIVDRVGKVVKAMRELSGLVVNGNGRQL